MILGKTDEQEILKLTKDDVSKILEYKISRTNDKGLILDIKMDVSDSDLELITFTAGNTQEETS